MSPIKLAVLLICCMHLGNAAEVETKPTDAQAEAVATTKLTPSVEEPKSKTEKRDSSDQTATVYTSKAAKESHFRPIYPSATYYEAAESGPIFEPTTLRYTSADAAPQSYYEKPESGSIRYVAPTAAEQHKHASTLAGLPGPLQFAPQHQPQHQQQHQQQPHRFRFAVPQQVELYQRPVVKSPAPQQQTPIYSYAESEPSLYERAGPQQYQLAATASSHQQLPQRFQYIIAIPLSYMRQLQQQLGAGQLPLPAGTAASSSTTSSTTTTTAAAPTAAATPAAAASHPIMQLFGPLARDHQGMYRPYYQSDSASAPSAVPTPIAAYGQHYLQIPANVLLAAAQQLQQQQHPQQHQFQAIYPKAASTPASLYQPLVYQPQPQPQPQLQLQLQRIYQQTPTIYAEQPLGQQNSLYAYPLHQQQQQQQQQQQHQARLLRLGLKQAQQQHNFAAAPSAATSSAPAPATTAATTTTLMLPTATAAAHEQHQQQHQALPLVHYNPIYVQAPAEHQHQHQQQHQFAILPRFSNNNPKAAYNLAHESTQPIHVVRLSAANALGHQQPQPLHHYHQFQPALHHNQPHQQQQQQFYQTHAGPLSNYAEEQQQQPQQHQQQQQHSQSPVSPAIIPYFSHPGAVHYGTHLYHPAAGTTASVTSAKQHQQQQLQLQQQRLAAATTATSGRLPGDNGNGGAGVKPPTAAANIVKYP